MLHIIKKSPYESNSLNECLKYIEEGDNLLFTEDGVYALKKGGVFEELINNAMANCHLFYLAADAKARGLQDSEIIEKVGLIDYKGFVEKVCEQNPLTWD
jgi:tRNA 2-thiouridine synthesizing protein B